MLAGSAFGMLVHSNPPYTRALTLRAFLPGLQCLDGTLMDLTWDGYVLGVVFSRGQVLVYNEGP